MSSGPNYFSNIFLSLLVLAGGGGIAAYFVLTKAKPTTKKPKPIVALVEVQTAEPTEATVRIRAMGTVEPAREVWVQPQVTGSVIEVNPKLKPGATFHQGEWLFRIDQRDYENAVEQARVAVVRAEFDIKVEEGRGTVAKREWQLFDQEIPATPEGKALALRQPHKESAFAQLAAAKSQLAQSRLNLSRTELVAPFNCLVVEESVDPGQQVSPQVRAARIVGTDLYRVRAAVPVNDLRWIHFPQKPGETGAAVVVKHLVDDEYPIRREGYVARLFGDLDATGRLGKVLVEVRDPLGLAIPPDSPRPQPLLLNAYVHVSIEGETLKDIFVLPRAALREGREIWLMDASKHLEIRTVEIAWQDGESVYIAGGLQSGEQVIVSSLSTPIKGMQLAVAGDEPRLTDENGQDPTDGTPETAPPESGDKDAP